MIGVHSRGGKGEGSANGEVEKMMKKCNRFLGVMSGQASRSEVFVPRQKKLMIRDS